MCYILMKTFLHLLLTLSISYSSFAQTSKDDLSFATEVLYRKIANLNQKAFLQESFAEYAYLKRTYKLDSFALDNDKYIGSLNDYYYKNFYLYSKLLNDNAIVTEDCITEQKIPQIKKLLFYTLYPKQIKLPANFIDQIEEQSTIDEFFGPYYALIDIYFLKKYNYSNLSLKQIDKLSKLESFLCNLLYTKYIVDKQEWTYHKFLSLKVLKMNAYAPADTVDFDLLVKFIKYNKDKEFDLSDSEKNNKALMDRIGYKKVLDQEINAALWIFLLELNKN